MKRFTPLLGFLCFSVIAFCMIREPQISVSAIQYGLQLCANAILPSLFPFFVFSDIWVRSGNAAIIAHTAEPMMRHLFHISGTAALPMLLGAVGGYPIGARTVAQLYTDHQISKDDAEQALLFCNNAGPAFIIGVVGSTIFRSTVTGILLYIIHLLAAIMIGVLFRPKHSPEDTNKIKIAPRKEKIPFYLLATDSIKYGGQTALQVCIYILFFSLISNMIKNTLSNYMPDMIMLPILGLLELTTGLSLMGRSILEARLQFVLTALLLGFGGICVMFQSLSILSPSGLSGKKLFAGKSAQGILSGVVAYFIWPMMSDAIPCFHILQKNNVSVQQFAITLALISTFIFVLKISTGNRKKYRI